MDPAAFITVAERLKDSESEADLRTAVGRYYYAVFRQARALIEGAGRPVPVQGAHGCVKYYLSTAAERLPALDPVAKTLTSMKIDRQLADYEIDTAFAKGLATIAHKRATEFRETLASIPPDRLKTALMAVPRCPEREQTA